MVSRGKSWSVVVFGTPLVSPLLQREWIHMDGNGRGGIDEPREGEVCCSRLPCSVKRDLLSAVLYHTLHYCTLIKRCLEKCKITIEPRLIPSWIYLGPPIMYQSWVFLYNHILSTKMRSREVEGRTAINQLINLDTLILNDLMTLNLPGISMMGVTWTWDYPGHPIN